jgi:hypothetical protein
MSAICEFVLLSLSATSAGYDNAALEVIDVIFLTNGYERIISSKLRVSLHVACHVHVLSEAEC